MGCESWTNNWLGGSLLHKNQWEFWRDIPLHSPYIGRIYGRYLQFRFLKFPLKKWQKNKGSTKVPQGSSPISAAQTDLKNRSPGSPGFPGRHRPTLRFRSSTSCWKEAMLNSTSKARSNLGTGPVVRLETSSGPAPLGNVFNRLERRVSHRIHVCYIWIYLVTFTINIPPMLVYIYMYIPYVDPMGMAISSPYVRIHPNQSHV